MLSQNFLVSGRLADESAENREGFVVSSVGREPSRRLGNDEDEKDDGDDEDRLEGNGNSPSFATGHGGESISDPVSDKDTQVEQRELEADESTSIGFRRDFGLQDGDSGVDEALDRSAHIFH